MLFWKIRLVLDLQKNSMDGPEFCGVNTHTSVLHLLELWTDIGRVLSTEVWIHISFIFT